MALTANNYFHKLIVFFIIDFVISSSGKHIFEWKQVQCQNNSFVLISFHFYIMNMSYRNFIFQLSWKYFITCQCLSLFWIKSKCELHIVLRLPEIVYLNNSHWIFLFSYIQNSWNCQEIDKMNMISLPKFNIQLEFREYSIISARKKLVLSHLEKLGVGNKIRNQRILCQN